MTMNRPRVRSLLREPQDESGAIAIYVALLLMILMIVAAFAIDISRWYVELQRLQRAADAGALAAAPLMPSTVTGNPSGRAYAEAVSTVGRNGYPASGVTAYNVPGSATRVKVTVQSTVTNSFASLFGFTTATLHRSGTADFAGPVAIGSPCNVFGREDMESEVNRWGSGSCDSEGKYWANISGEYVNKARGDAFASTWCTKPDGAPTIEGCDGINPTGDAPASNLENAGFLGYVFKVRAKRSGTLHLEGYDMGWVATGKYCNDASELVGVEVKNFYVKSEDDARLRYARGEGRFCTGDSQEGPPEGDNSKVATTITIRGPSIDPYRPLEGAPLCGPFTLPGWDRSTPLAELEAPGDSNQLARTYHRWDELIPGCTVEAVAGKDYVIQVQTSGGGGQNRFALRASYGGIHTSENDLVSISAVDRVSLYNNVTAGQSTFNLVRLDSSSANHTLSVGFFGIGDADPNATVKATVLQPDLDTAFENCSGVGPATGTLPGCYVVAKKVTNGGRWQTITIPIPSTYSCSDDDDQSKCWVRVRLDTTAGQADTGMSRSAAGSSVSTSTTWIANLEGDPVRLVE